MPSLDLHLRSTLHDSFRVRQVAGMFDLPISDCVREHFRAQLPELSENWRIGLITGPSGSGKTAVAKAEYRRHLHQPAAWPADRAVIDCFGDDISIHRITRVLTSVGLSSPPTWMKPYAVLSNGEKFRCELARAVMERWEENREFEISNRKLPNEGTNKGGACDAPQFDFFSFQFSIFNSVPLVIDEYSSTVDRTTAKTASLALSNAIRTGKIPVRFVAVTCHDDIIPWLRPDWILRMPEGKLTRETIARPPIRLKVRRVSREMWPLFRRHHYLSGALHPAAQCFVAYMDGKPAAFCAALPFPHPRRPGWREHRLVCLPDYQGIGIGNALSAFVAGMYVATGKPYFSTTGHPATMRHRAKSPLWRMLRTPGMVSPVYQRDQRRTGMDAACSIGRLTASFEYTGPPRMEEARMLKVVKDITTVA